MVVIDTEPWADSDKEKDVQSTMSNKQLFGFQDLASDYYQVNQVLNFQIFQRFSWANVLSDPLIEECEILQIFTSEVLRNFVLITFRHTWQS